MRVIVLYEQKKYISEIKQKFTKEDLIKNMRQKLGDKETQQYTLCDYYGVNIKEDHVFEINDKELILILMKIPQFKPEEPLYNDNIKEDIINITDDPKSLYDMMQKTPVNHGNPEKERKSCQELIANISGSFQDLPDLEKETSRKK